MAKLTKKQKEAIAKIEPNKIYSLADASSLVKDCQGDMQVASSLRKGTAVKISLPIYFPKRKKHAD